MIKKLRRKFILINMILVTVVLLIVFSALCWSNYRKLESDSINEMRRTLGRDTKMSPPKIEIGGKNKFDKPPFSILPIFCVIVDENGDVKLLSAQNVSISDETASNAAKQAIQQQVNIGTLSDLNLRYLKENTPRGIKIAFVDRSSETSEMTDLIVTSLLVGVGGLAGFFLIGLFLSNWALRPVEIAWEQQRQFIADASHELKTPLTVILANTGILLSHKDDTISNQSKWVEYTQTEATRMKKMVEDLLFLAKSDSSRVPMIQGEFNLSDAAWGCLLPFESMAFEQDIILESVVSPNVKFIGDEGQLKQLIIILLDNACKYSRHKGTINFSLESFGDKIKIAVKNTGTPIPKEQIAHLFERFYRVDKARSREEGGYGLGLAIAKQVVENHNGKISVESDETEGTVFTVSL